MKRLNYIGTEKAGILVSLHKWFREVHADTVIDCLSERLPIKNWVLTGGLAMDVMNGGKQIRPRWDVDIRLSMEQIRELIAQQGDKSHYLFGVEHFRLPYLLFLDGMTFPEEVSETQLRGKHLKLVSRSYLDGGLRDITDVIDVYTADQNGQDLTTKTTYDFRDDRLPYTTPNGHRILTSSPRYLHGVKKHLNRDKDRIDIPILERFMQSEQLPPIAN